MMKPKKLLREIFELGWEPEVKRVEPGVWTGEATRPNYKAVRTIQDTEAGAIEELNRLVRWTMAGKFLRPNECIATVNVGVPATA